MFAIDSQETEGTVLLKLSGELDTWAAGELDEYLAKLVPTLRKDLVVDLSELAFMNSSGLRSFLRLDKLMKGEGMELVIEGASRSVFKVFRYSGLDGYFTLR
ncbi:MAG TPA: STAS domain-containing protein [Stenomitos sp.]